MVDPSKWAFNRNRKGRDHIDNCDTGYPKEPSQITYRGKPRNVVEVHHLMCVHACSDATLPEDVKNDETLLDFIRKSLAITEWDINCGHNNIGLPRKWIYVIDTANNTKWGKLPCHQIDHDRYLATVEQYVTAEIWEKMQQNKKKGNCENMKGEAVVALFRKGSKEWRDFLVARGTQFGGTEASLKYCLEQETIDPVREETWYIPFSMAEASEIRPRVKPPLKTTLERKNLLVKCVK